MKPALANLERAMAELESRLLSVYLSCFRDALAKTRQTIGRR
jgi:hypothetical protein